MIVQGVDIVGYEWVKFTYFEGTPYHIVDGSDILLYGSNSSDFSYLFNINKSVTIRNSEYTDVTPGVVSRIGSILVQSNTVDVVILNILLTRSDSTKVLINNNSILIICNVEDLSNIDLGAISTTVKIVKLAKEYGATIGNIRDARILPRVKVNQPFYDNRTYKLSNEFLTNVNYTRVINVLNTEIANKLPEMEMIVGKRDKINQNKSDSIYCQYNTLNIKHKHFFKTLRRHQMHLLPVQYEFKFADTKRYLKMLYEFTNYDFITNICELQVNDDEGNPWVFAIHWKVDEPSITLDDPKNGSDTVSHTIKCTAEVNFFTMIDNYLKGVAERVELIKRITVTYKPGDQVVIIDEEAGIILT